MRITQQEITRKLHAEEAFADSFVSHILKRNIRMEEDLIDQLFNSTEKRLARTLLLLAQYGMSDGTQRALPKVSQEILAEMVGTTRHSGELLHEQVQEARVHRVRPGRCEGEPFAPWGRSDRLTTCNALAASGAFFVGVRFRAIAAWARVVEGIK